MTKSDASAAAGSAEWARARAAALVQALEIEAIEERRLHAEGYMATSMRLLGVPVPKIRAAARVLHRELRAEPPRMVRRMADALVATGTHEGRQAGYELLGFRHDVLAELDRRDVEGLGAGNDNWASVDCFATTVVGQAWRDGRVEDADVAAWARSDDPWWRRTALASTIPLNLASRGGEGDPARTLLICDLTATDAHPMVAKALSWALRTLVPHDPTGVRAFLERHGDEVPARVRREVTTKLETGRKNPGKPASGTG